MSNKNRDDRVIKDYSLRNEIFKDVKMDCRCPRKLNNLPTEPCPYALNKIYDSNVPDDKKCEWYIVHADSNYCFWAYNYFKNDRTHILDEIASLNNLSLTATNLLIKNALISLVNQYELKSYEELIDLLNIDISNLGD